MKKTVSFFSFVLVLQMLFAQNAPVAVNDTFSINKNNPTTFFITANDYDINGDPLTVSVTVPPVHGTASVSGNNVFYTPALNYTGTDSFIYVVCDTTTLCDTALVYITITGNNNDPVATDDHYVVQQNVNTFLPVTSNDYDPDADLLSITILTPPQHGSASVVNTVEILYVPDNSYSGPDTLVYVLCDSHNLCDTAVVFIAFTGNNNNPVAMDDNYVVQENVNTFLPVTSNDYDPTGDVLSITILKAPQHGNASVINSVQVLYAPYNFYFGPDTLVYVLCDNHNLCDTAVVYIAVNGANNPPTALDDGYTFGDSLNTVLLDVLSNDNDPENNSIYISQVLDTDSSNDLGIVTTDGNRILFTRSTLACGTETFSYLVCDYQLCDTGNLTITINCPDNVFLPEGFSPDGDGKNDRLVFTGLEYFSPASLKVYNRYGTLVYENAAYQNDWDGSASLQGGKGLPDGTYYYVLQLVDKRHYRNYLIINR